MVCLPDNHPRTRADFASVNPTRHIRPTTGITWIIHCHSTAVRGRQALVRTLNARINWVLFSSSWFREFSLRNRDRFVLARQHVVRTLYLTTAWVEYSHRNAQLRHAPPCTRLSTSSSNQPGTPFTANIDVCHLKTLKRGSSYNSHLRRCHTEPTSHILRRPYWARLVRTHEK